MFFPRRTTAIAAMLALAAQFAGMGPVLAAETFVLPTTSQPAVQGMALSPEDATRSVAPRAPGGAGSVAGAEAAVETIAVPKPEEEPLSAMENFFAKAPGLGGPPLRQFGYEMFLGMMGSGVTADTTVPPDYPLGPGDEIVINVPMSTQEIRAIVGRDGTIFIPNFGTLSLAGQTLDGFQKNLRARAKGSGISVRLAKLRTLTVYLSGRVRRPGSYTVNALSTVPTLFQMAGGVAKNGTLRRIQLNRRGKVVTTFDFYDFLLGGKSAGNLRLESGDIVYVPTAGAQVGIAGTVRNPAIYELEGPTSIQQAMTLAGGLMPYALTRQALLQRVRPNVGREVRELDLDKHKTRATPLLDGDLLIFKGVLDRVENGVEIAGYVERPGLYEIREGTRISELIGSKVELKPETYLDAAQIRRETGPDRHIEVVAFNLGKALAGDKASDLALRPRDVITIYSLKEYDANPEVKIYGAVLRPGSFRVYPKMRVSTLIQMAGGLLPEADGTEGELSRTVIKDRKATVERSSFSPLNALGGDTAADVLAQRGDAILIKAASNYRQVRVVEVAGEVARPGSYGLVEGERMSSLIERAGGFTRRAYLAGSILTRESVQKLQQQQIADLADKLEQSLLVAQVRPTGSGEDAAQKLQSLVLRQDLLDRLRKTNATGRVVVAVAEPERMHSSRNDIQLEAGDRLYVPPINETISVLGAVYAPNAFKHDPDMSVEDYLKLAGGATRQGDFDNLYVVRADGQVHSLQNYQEPFLLVFRRNLLGSRLNAGDTIIIPDKIDYRDPLVDVGRITSILAQSATTAGVLYGIFKP